MSQGQVLRSNFLRVTLELSRGCLTPPIFLDSNQQIKSKSIKTSECQLRFKRCFLIFSLDCPVTKNQMPAYVFCCCFNQAVLFSFQIEMTTKNLGWYLVFSIWFLVTILVLMKRKISKEQQNRMVLKMQIIVKT